MGEEVVCRLFDKELRQWSNPPHGHACEVLEPYSWPENARVGADLGLVVCAMRTVGGINCFNIKRVAIPLEGLVFACDWVLSTLSKDLTIRGTPVPEGSGSPLAVAMKTSSGVMVAGSSLDVVLGNRKLYMRGKEKLSVLVIGFYCARKATKVDAAVFHVSSDFDLS